jgi:hypothetical protein
MPMPSPAVSKDGPSALILLIVDLTAGEALIENVQSVRSDRATEPEVEQRQKVVV